MLTLETQDDPDGTLFARVRDRVAGLARDERQQQEELRALGAAVAAIPLVEPRLLDDLPTTPIDLSGVPNPVLRPFFESLLLQIRYDRRTHKTTGHVSLDEAAVGLTTALVSVINGDETDSRPFPCCWCRPTEPLTWPAVMGGQSAFLLSDPGARLIVDLGLPGSSPGAASPRWPRDL